MDRDYGKNYIECFSPLEEWEEAMLNMERVFRVNTLKISIQNFLEFTSLKLKETPLPFAFSLPKDFPIGNTLEFFLGYIHTQTLSSMLPAVVLNPKPHTKVIDCCASPGGKTTLISMLMRNTGAVVANDVKVKRLSSLVGNINRLGALNVVVTLWDARKLPYKECFDKALVDAPCSNLGSSLSAIKMITKKKVKSLSRVQKRMIVSAFDSLRQGGELVYSTCTITEEENEEVVKFLLEKRENAKLVGFDLGVKHDRGLVEYGKEFNKVARIYPFHFNSEGFFIAKIKKE